MKYVIAKPPAKNVMVAMIDDNCKFANSKIECPDVQPFAYRVPNPTKKPLIIRSTRPLIFCRLYKSLG